MGQCLKQTISSPSSPQRFRLVLGLLPVGDLTGAAGADTTGAFLGASLDGATLIGALVGHLLLRGLWSAPLWVLWKAFESEQVWVSRSAFELEPS
jgi:hypothetical protein